MDEIIIYKYLEELRDKYQREENSFSLPVYDTISVEGKKYDRNIWLEECQGNKLVIFKLESKALIGSKNYCLGLEVSNNGTSKMLTNENLWEIGIP